MKRAAKWSLRAAVLAAGGVGLGWLALAAGRAPAARASAPPGPRDAVPAAAHTLNPERAEDETAIRAVDAEFVRAFNAGDADAVVASFTDDAQVVDPSGKAFTGRKAVRERFAQSFAASPGMTLALDLRSLRFVGPDTAVERGAVSLRHADAEAAEEPAPYTVVYVRRGGKWLQASVEDHARAPEPEPASNEERLRPLAWMVGDWVSESADAVVLSTCQWDAKKNFILHQFTIQAAGRPAHTGTQRIGWDPVRQQIRSWVFDDDGGFGDCRWSQDPDGRWVVRASGTRPDGRATEATRLVTPLDAHRVQWEIVHRTLGGVAQPDVPAFVMVRKPPAPGAALAPAPRGGPPAPSPR